MPARFRDIKRELEKIAGIQVLKPKKGSHWKVVRAGFRPFPIPAHNGPKTEIDDYYIRALCQHFGIAEQTFRAGL